VQATGFIDLDDLQACKKHSMMRAYAQSKLANVLFTYALAQCLAGTGVIVNCFHPGNGRDKYLESTTTRFSEAVRGYACETFRDYSGRRSTNSIFDVAV
jgi:NAD(P)-dependent dehydrogenase (short-subunit alcohol dehydrogenase family)